MQDLNLNKAIDPERIFYTRPFNTLEMTSLLEDWCLPEEKLKTFNNYSNLFSIPKIRIGIYEHTKSIIKLKIPDGNRTGDLVAALTSLHTGQQSWLPESEMMVMSLTILDSRGFLD